MGNKERYFEKDGTPKPEALQNNVWLKYLLSADYWNAERIEKMSDKNRNTVLEYVLKTLDILDSITGLSDEDYRIIKTVLCWSEVAKGGTEEDRKRWINRGYPLDIHNEASAMIYADHTDIRNPKMDFIYVLIQTHGLPGQFLRGECSSALIQNIQMAICHQDDFDFLRFCQLFDVLNECIIKAVSNEIWLSVKSQIHEMAVPLYDGELYEIDAETRLKALLPNNGEVSYEVASYFSRNVFGKYDLWYFQTALEPFGFSNAQIITQKAVQYIAGDNDIKHINFKPLADTMYYDFNGKKHINTYKQRIIEQYLKDETAYSEHVKFTFKTNGEAVLVGVEFTPVCEKLIDFCVEAERSGLLSYEKSITMLYDMFGFRRDKFDRLNNEESYLNTMNTAKESTKMSIINYVVGEKIVDVGSGGGILLDALEEKYPNKTIIGTDISRNVIETLNKKKAQEHHSWNIIQHNFVDSVLNEKVDSILFSSILHEIYSYSNIGNGKFDKQTLVKTLTNAYNSLNKNGRIIIRDGIKTEESINKMKICFKNKSGIEIFMNFCKDFHGLDRELSDNEKCSIIDTDELFTITDMNFGREFLYTYTWGTQSFPHEVQECFGYYTLDEYVHTLEHTGFRIKKANAFLELGYKQHLSKLVDIYMIDGYGQEKEMEYPNSNCIIVAEK